MNMRRLRSGCGQLLLDNDVRIDEVKEQLGHKRIETTITHYSRPKPQKIKARVEDAWSSVDLEILGIETDTAETGSAGRRTRGTSQVIESLVRNNSLLIAAVILEAAIFLFFVSRHSGVRTPIVVVLSEVSEWNRQSA